MKSVYFDNIKDGKHYIREDWVRTNMYVTRADTRYVDKNVLLLVKDNDYIIYKPSKLDYKKKWIEL